MTSTLPLTALETALAWVAHASWHAAVLGLLVFLVSLALRGGLEARWRFCLWLVVFARLTLPTTPHTPWSLFRLVPMTVAVPAAGNAVAGLGAAPTPKSLDPVATDTAGEGVTEFSPQRIDPGGPRGEQSTATIATTGEWLAVAWLAGVLGFLARLGWLHVALRRRLRAGSEVSNLVVQDAFRRCREELGGVRAPRLRIAADLLGPATYGAFRASILLPEKLLPVLDPDELRLVLLHELTHVRRWDVLIDRIATLLVALHWFNPVAWLALVCLRRERERACDAAVLRHLGSHDPGRYGQALLKVAEQLSAPTPLPGAVGVFVKDRSLDRRIHMIAQYRKPTAARRALGGLLLVVLGASGLTDAMGEPADEAVAHQAPLAAKAENAKAFAVTGVCQDDDGTPLPGVQVAIYREDQLQLKVERLRSERTGQDGRFHFGELPPPPPPEEGQTAWGYILVITKPGRGSILQPLFAGSPTDRLEFKLRPAATLQGRVTDSNGKPVSGARVWAHSWMSGAVEGVGSTRTDADGRYAITDMFAWGPDVLKPKQVDKGMVTQVVGCYFDVLHPDYGHERPMYRRMPETVDVVLQPAGIIDGRVVDQVTGKPAAGVMVCMQGTNGTKGGGWHQTRTDSSGNYRFSSLIAATYNLWAQAPDRACTALDSFAVDAGKKHAAPDLSLIEGGWIEGRLIDVTGKPIVRGSGRQVRLQVGLYGPSRPKSGAACQASVVDDQGRFRLHVAPGVNFPYLMTQDYWERTQRREYFHKGIEVRSGEVVSVVFRILPEKPISDPDPAPVRLPVPVAAERRAAELVRQLGGWYQVDADNHVIEVNMVYHEEPDGRRYDNDRTDTDKALRAVSAFPRLKRLYLHWGQATDDGLRSLAKLTELEELMVWNAGLITDAGVGHLAGLSKLRDLHFSNGRLADGSLAVFGRLPSLRTLSLQGNFFSDEGLRHLGALKQLQSLWVGMNKPPMTDAGARHLTGLTSLEGLDLQGAQLSDAAVGALKNLKQLRTLYLSGRSVTDASVEPLLGMTKLQRLGIQNTRLTEQGLQRLLALPDLKELMASSSAISEGLQDQLRQQRPGLRLYVSVVSRQE